MDDQLNSALRIKCIVIVLLVVVYIVPTVPLDKNFVGM